MKKKKRGSAGSVRDRVLDALLAQATFDGWTGAAYAAALQEAGVTRAQGDKLFPEGLGDLAEMFGARADEAMQKRIAGERGFLRMRVRDKVAFGVRARLEAMAPHRDGLRRLMVWYAMPMHVPGAIRRFARTVDLIWRAAGDVSTDYNFYTKRILLAGVLKATMLFWLSDESEGFAATWVFLDRRIGEVLKVGKGIGLLREFSVGELVGMVRERVGRVV